MERSEYIDIDHPRETIIIEKLDGKTIVEGSHLYCGMCGRTLGTMREPITFPFDSVQLIEKMQFRTFIHGVRGKMDGKNIAVNGISHSACSEPMFVNTNKWNFISLPEYKSLIFREKLLKR